MAKEMMIVFVYDTQACTSEDDDPINSVLYFHPGWVSDTQRHALAGQVVGAAHCVKALFAAPVAVSLQSGKFIIREYGRYILAIGSDRNIPSWVLASRARLLSALLKVFHGDLQALAAPLPSARRLADRLYQLFETYLPVLQFGCHIFQRVPMLTLPKSATSVYMEAMQILEQCRKNKGVLGGIVLYNNKIVATQLPPNLTSYLTVVDPYRIKSPAEALETEAPLPLGAQLLAVYVARKTYHNLKKQADSGREFSQNGEEMIARFKKNQEAERDKREFPTGMKRDKSLLFTAVPEEEPAAPGPPVGPPEAPARAVPDVVPFASKPRPRPTKLALSFRPQHSLDEHSKENEQVFTGQTSVCSTPMLEYKRLHGNMLSICRNPDPRRPDRDAEPDVLKNIENCAKLPEHEKRDNINALDVNCIADRYIDRPEPMRKLASVTDIRETLRNVTNRATSKFKLKRSPVPPNDDTSPETMHRSVSTMTINDPSFPVFRSDGVAISESLFNQYLEHHYASMKRDMSREDNMFAFNTKLREQDKFEGFDWEPPKSPQRTPKKFPKDSTRTVDQSRRKSLSLPLKSLSESSDSQTGSDSDAASFKKKLSGVQLTPLMEKLSLLAADKSSGYSSRGVTPLPPTPLADRLLAFHDGSRPNPPRLASDSDCDSDDDLDALPTYSAHAVKCGLFVSGLHNMALLALVDVAVDADAVNSLWETSLSALGAVEQRCSEPAAAEGAADYSCLALDPQWGSVRRAGPWAPPDVAALGLVRRELAADPALSELSLRSDDSVVLGVSLGGAQIYYQESGARGAGPPAPSDPLAAAPLRARRRLHRDHAAAVM